MGTLSVVTRRQLTAKDTKSTKFKNLASEAFVYFVIFVVIGRLRANLVDLYG